MQKIYGSFEERNVTVIAVAQEDTDLKTHGKMLKRFGKDGPKFEVVADLNRKVTTRYDRTSAYLIDKQGIVRQIFPMLIHSRPSWQAILSEIDNVLGEGS